MKPRPRFQFSLRLLLIVITAFGIWLGIYLARVREQRTTVAALKALGAEVLRPLP